MQNLQVFGFCMCDFCRQKINLSI